MTQPDSPRRSAEARKVPRFPWRRRMRRFAKRLVGRLRGDEQTILSDDLGRDLSPGDPHYRAFVGPPRDYDLIGGLTFSVLFAAGLREHHRVVDLGCGSLRAGRLLIPYLLPGRYVGIEPNQWLVDEALTREVGQELIALKRPQFVYSEEFPVDELGVEFDWVVAQSIFSHTYRDLFEKGMERVSAGLKDDGVLVATYVDDEPTAPSEGWRYPGCVNYRWEDVEEIAGAIGLSVTRLQVPHPRQVWFAASRSHERATEVAGKARLTTASLP